MGTMTELLGDASAGATNPAAQEDLPTPETLISGTVAALRNCEATDTELLDILAEHILTMTPAANGVTDAASAIEALAARRAEGPDHGDAGYD
jgi:hypothetical protein